MSKNIPIVMRSKHFVIFQSYHGKNSCRGTSWDNSTTQKTEECCYIYRNAPKKKKIKTFTSPWALEYILVIACNVPLTPKPKCPGKEL